jgi:hypothetical protein
MQLGSMAVLLGTLVINLVGIYFLYRVSHYRPEKDKHVLHYVDDRQYPQDHKTLVGYKKAGYQDHAGRHAYVNERNEVFYESPIIEEWLS